MYVLRQYYLVSQPGQQFENPIEFQNKNSRQSDCRVAGVGISYHSTEGLALNNPARAQSQPLVLRPHRPLQ